MASDLYFDYCATTPLHPEVRKSIITILDNNFGNPSSMHSYGRIARESVEKARKNVADGISASPEEISFTSGATEANNLALFGVLQQDSPGKNHLIISAIEHHAILHTAQALEAAGHPLTILPVDQNGFVSADTLEDTIRPETALVSIMHVNNEVGTIQDISQLAEISHQKGVLFHTDAVQALPSMKVDVDQLGVDLLSLSGHKMYGPKGIGALYIRSGTNLKPLFYGGSQEHGRRPGTENVPGIVGLGAAMEIRTRNLDQNREQMQKMRQRLVSGLLEVFPDCVIHGPSARVAPHVISAGFPGVDGETLLFHLSQNNVAVSLGSACTSENLEPSHVLTAMGLAEDIIDGTLRFSLGEPTTPSNIDDLLGILSNTIGKAALG